MKTGIFWIGVIVMALNVMVALPASAAAVSADGGGFHIRSDDGLFSANLGGRIQFDGYATHPDKDSKFNSGIVDNTEGTFTSGTYFRRVQLNLSGTVYGFNYLVIDNLAASTPSAGLYQVWISHDLGPGTLYIGQHRPWRSFDDMTSNADTLFLERNVLSDKGIYGGREFAQGLFYRMLFQHPLFKHDHLFIGLSGYSLGNTVQDTSPQKGVGYNARIAYAPFVEHKRWLHMEVSFSSDHSGNGHPLRAYFKGYYGYKGETQMVVDLTDSSDVDSPRVNTEATEVAAAYGPFLIKGGVAWAQFRQDGMPSQVARAYSVEASVFLTGEMRPYHIHSASMSIPEPVHSYGAVELAAGYNNIRNLNYVTGDLDNCHRAASASYPHSKYNACEVSSITTALNYYVNPNVRFTVEGILGNADLGSDQVLKDNPYTVEARAQLNW